MKKCVILYNKPGQNASPDELDVLDQVNHVSNSLSEIEIDVSSKGITTDFMNEINSLLSEKPDFVFNLVESINNKGELNYFVPALLNMYSIPYTGNPLEAIFITTSKALTANILKLNGINTPVTFLPSEENLFKPGKQYIIKPTWEDGSMGITSESVFTFEKGSEGRFSSFDDRHWIIQEYIEGREFNVSVISGPEGPEVMPPAEMTFIGFDDRPKIVDFKAKWIEDSFEYINTVRTFPDLDNMLARKINETALACWHAFGLKGYARVDMRVDSDENVYVIEVNANPCISPDSGLAAATKKAGLTFTGVVSRIINDLNY
ncbi:MAG: ATP-grasp domain-containing protein [Bacteroidales bacterium]|nr:ATP-grasp domain-containing protein [Bacteroidales bacterium]